MIKDWQIPAAFTALGVVLAFVAFSAFGFLDRGELRRLRAERDGYREAAILASGHATSLNAKADSIARVADSLTAIRRTAKKPRPQLPALPPICDTLKVLLAASDAAYEAVVIESDTWQSAYLTQKEAYDSLETAYVALQKADSLSTEVEEELEPLLKRNLLAKILPKPGFGLFAGGCATSGGYDSAVRRWRADIRLEVLMSGFIISVDDIMGVTQRIYEDGDRVILETDDRAANLQIAEDVNEYRKSQDKHTAMRGENVHAACVPNTVWYRLPRELRNDTKAMRRWLDGPGAIWKMVPNKLA